MEVNSVLRAAVKQIIDHAEHYSWSVQGFGMLRLYFGQRWRLHIWDSKLAYPGVSTIHDHLQWHFESIVLSGRITNYRFQASLTGLGKDAEPYRMAKIQTGPAGFKMEEGRGVFLIRRTHEVYVAGQTYSQRNNEIHESRPDDGTVTLVERQHTDEGDIAYVFWPEGQQWVTAEPRPATKEEVAMVTSRAREVWLP